MRKIPAPEEALFADALARPPTQRIEFLTQACGADDFLRARVAALLAAHEGPENLLGTEDFPARWLDLLSTEERGVDFGHAPGT